MDHETFTVVQISDLHVDPVMDAHLEWFDRCRRMVDRLGPDLIIITGDISVDGFREHHQGMFEALRGQLDQLSAPYHCVPGNHDVGNKPGEVEEYRRSYLEKWKHVFGADHFLVQRGSWVLCN